MFLFHAATASTAVAAAKAMEEICNASDVSKEMCKIVFGTFATTLSRRWIYNYDCLLAD